MRSIGSSRAWVYGMGLALCAAAPLGAGGEDLTVTGLNLERTITCDERDVVVEGVGNRLTLRGRCQDVTVHGTDHVIHVERLGSLHLTGMNNRVEWEAALRGDRPDIHNTGINNRAVRAEGRSTARREGGEADPDRVTVQGDGGRIVLGSDGISIDGNAKGRRGGQVTVDAGGTSVRVDGGTGTVSVGGGSSAGRALTISDSEVERDYDCAGGNVVVSGSDNQLTLRRCRELTVNGGDNHIVLVGPVRLIRLAGADNRVEWSEGEGGRAPRVETPSPGRERARRPTRSLPRGLVDRLSCRRPHV
jgi:DUF3060 family protein